MPNEKTLRISKKTLSTRKKAEELVKEAKTNGYTKIDFSKVEFISRSFADEFLIQTEKLDIEIEDTKEKVERMLEIADSEGITS